MFPIFASGFFVVPASTAKPNTSASASGPIGMSSPVALGLPFAYDTDLNSYALLSTIGSTYNNGTPPLPTEFWEANFTNTPNTGAIAGSTVTLQAIIKATFAVSDVKTGGRGQYPNIYLNLIANGTYSDASAAPSNQGTLLLLNCNGAAANATLAAGNAYQGSFNGIATLTWGPFSGKTLDVNGITINVQWQYDSSPDGATQSFNARIDGAFSCGIYDLKYIYS